MTTGPKLRLGETLLPGVLAVALFGLMALIVLNTQFSSMTGYPDGVAITSEIGYAMFDLTVLQSGEGAIGDTEPFLISFLLAAIVLDAALDASLVLAKREEKGESTSPAAFGDVGASGSSTLDAGTDRPGEATPATDGGRATDANDAVDGGIDADRPGGGDR